MSYVYPKNNTYTGNRYVPKHCGDWDNTKNTQYESLSVVYYSGNTYTSKNDVPIGIDITNTAFWVKSADFNLQLSNYHDEFTNYKGQNDININNIDSSITGLSTSVNNNSTNIQYNNNKFDSLTLNALYPPVPLVGIKADSTNNDITALINLLTFININGGGKLMLPPNKIIKLNGGFTIPQNVTIEGLNTLLDFSGAGDITAITISSNGYIPLIGVNIKGNNTGNGTSFTTTNSTAISITGAYLKFFNVQIFDFNIGINIAHSNTYLLEFTSCQITNCGTCIYGDLYANSATTAGERIVFSKCLFANSQLICRASSNSLDMYFDNCSFDYSNNFFVVIDACIFFDNCHFESKLSGNAGEWYSVNNYLFDTASNGARLQFTNVNFQLYGMRYIINPSGYHVNARATFYNCMATSLDSDGVTRNHYSSEDIFSAVSSTSIAIRTPFVSQISHPFATSSSNWNNMQNNVIAYISAVDVANALITISFSVALPHNGYTKLIFN